MSLWKQGCAQAPVCGWRVKPEKVSGEECTLGGDFINECSVLQ